MNNDVWINRFRKAGVNVPAGADTDGLLQAALDHVKRPYPYSDTVKELKEIAQALRQMAMILTGFLPRFCVTKPDEKNFSDIQDLPDIQEMVDRVFTKMQGGQVGWISEEDARMLKKYIHRV